MEQCGEFEGCCGFERRGSLDFFVAAREVEVWPVFEGEAEEKCGILLRGCDLVGCQSLTDQRLDLVAVDLSQCWGGVVEVEIAVGARRGVVRVRVHQALVDVATSEFPGRHLGVGKETLPDFSDSVSFAQAGETRWLGDGLWSSLLRWGLYHRTGVVRRCERTDLDGWLWKGDGRSALDIVHLLIHPVFCDCRDLLNTDHFLVFHRAVESLDCCATQSKRIHRQLLGRQSALLGVPRQGLASHDGSLSLRLVPELRAQGAV